MSIFSALRCAWRNTREMPFLLRMYCQGAMTVAPLTLFVLALPIVEWTVNGQVMSYEELWSSGAGAALALIVLLVGVGGWGLALRVPSARWAWVITPVAPYASLLIPGASAIGQSLVEATTIAEALLTAGAIYLLLFRLQSVRRYLLLTGAEDRGA